MLNIEQQITKQIDKAKNILITFPADWDGDSVAAALSFFTFLKKTDKTVEIAASSPKRDIRSLSFLPYFSEIKNSLDHLRRFIVSLDISKTKVSQIKYVVENNQLNFIVSPQDGWFEPQDVSAKAGEFKYDLIIVIGANDLESLGVIYDNNVEFFYKTAIVNISCQAANEEFGQINFIDLNRAAVSEMIYRLLTQTPQFSLDEDMATGLLSGIIIKTRNFKTGNLTPETLMITSELIGAGARREEIINRLYRSRNIYDLKLWGKILNNLNLEAGNELAWSWLSLNDVQGANFGEDQISDMVDELMSNLPETKIVLILLEQGPASTKVFAFSLKNINALEILNGHHPQGNGKIAFAPVNQDLNTAITEVIGDIRKRLEKIN